MSLSNFLTKLTFIIIFVCTVIIFLINIIFQYKYHQDDLTKIKNEYILSKKEAIKKEVNRVYEYIKFKEQRNTQSLKNLQDEVLSWIETIRFDKSGYIFVNNLNAQALVFDGKKLTSATNHPNIEVYRKIIESLNNKKEAFISYKFKKINTQDSYEKLSFVKVYENWGWIIGTGIYLDELDLELQKKGDEFKKSVLIQITFMLVVFFILLIIFYFFAKRTSNYINKNIDNLLYSFKNSSIQNKKIETKELTFDEFISLANSLNKILEDKNKTEKKLQDYFKIVDENILISTTNKQGVITYVSKAFCDISGYSKDELIGKNDYEIKDPEIVEEFYQKLWNKLNNGEIFKGEIKNRTKDGKTFWVDAVIQPLIEDGELKGYTALRQNITDKKKIEYLSEIDDLTQLYNRRKFNFVIEDELNRKKRENTLVSFMILDVDFFKPYNDTYGHQKGDETLAKIAKVLSDNTKRVGDFAFRLGGEEFAILLNSDSKLKVYDHAMHIKNIIEELKIEHASSKVCEYVTISIGIICKESINVKNTNELYKLADLALYKAKNQGRNCVYIDS